MLHSALDGAVLPSFIRCRAEETPDSTFAIFPTNDGLVTHVTFLQYAQACHRFARAVCPDAPLKIGYTVGIVAVCDTLSYIAAIGGLTSAGLPVRELTSHGLSSYVYESITGLPNIPSLDASGRHSSAAKCLRTSTSCHALYLTHIHPGCSLCCHRGWTRHHH
jgi:hypothetical protein